MMGTLVPFCILAVLFLALMGFVYLLVNKFFHLVRKLTNTISELKSFSMGKPEPEKKPEFVDYIQPDEDFGTVHEEDNIPEEEL